MTDREREKLQKIKVFLFDLDGTVYLDGVLYPRVKETLEKLSKRAEICYLTNNSSRTKAAYLKRLQNIGLAVDARSFMSSTDAAVGYLLRHHQNERIYAVATDEVKAEIADAGVTLCEDRPDVVLLAYDTTLTFEKLVKICRFVTLGATFYATHPDINCPAPVVMHPDVGSFLALIQASTTKRPDKIFGKPFSHLAQAVIERFGVAAEEIAMVGDRLATDMLFAQNNDFLSVLTLTGETRREMIGGRAPDVIVESVADLQEIL